MACELTGTEQIVLSLKAQWYHGGIDLLDGSAQIVFCILVRVRLIQLLWPYRSNRWAIDESAQIALPAIAQSLELTSNTILQLKFHEY